MKRFEQILLKLVIIQFVFLLTAQVILLYTPFSPYFSKMIDYEGVNKSEAPQTIETFFHDK
ncbi:YpfB family protein [Litchfieldia alkalitelluris]|uniref:YpfB family protein n=1 Tax=Litchfieldia alkalitelluris TaxID=304268 RepID=UPI000995F860|nr:YpfB family protein [Litchfieldia alkalitelluris]